MGDHGAPPYRSRAGEDLLVRRRRELERDAGLVPELAREPEILEREVEREADVVAPVQDHLALRLVHEARARARADHLVGLTRDRARARLASMSASPQATRWTNASMFVITFRSVARAERTDVEDPVADRLAAAPGAPRRPRDRHPRSP